MDLLGNPGIQNNLDSIIKKNPEIVKEQKKTPENQFSKKKKKIFSFYYFSFIFFNAIFFILILYKFKK